jgi:hypothetical protein
MLILDTIDEVAPFVEEALGTGAGCWIDRNLGWVTCPGCARHTTANSPNDCKVFPNYDKTPRLYCFHQSCATDIADINQKLRSAVFAAKRARIRKRIELTDDQRDALADHACWEGKATAAKQRILAEYAWTVDAMIEASPTDVANDVASQWKQLVGLFRPDDIVWAGSLFDSGDPKHTANFKTPAEWIAAGSIPGQYVCPSVFKMGVSSRTARNVEHRRYLVVESDTLTKNEVASIYRWIMTSVGLHLAAVVDTGGKSLHGWFQRPDPELEDALRIILPVLGCDQSMFLPSQVCRLPGAERDGGYQRLLYLAEPGTNRPCDLENIVPLPAMFYDRITKNWYIPDGRDGWFNGYERDVERHLKEAGYTPSKGKSRFLSDCERALNRLQKDNCVDYAAPLAGYMAGVYEVVGRRVLVTTSPKLMPPVKGDFGTLERLFRTMLGDEQLQYFYSWLHVSLTMFYRHQWRAGQVIAFAGPVNAGKSLVQKLLTKMFGGREEDPYTFITDRTKFNGALFGAEHLKIEDQAESVDIRTRRHLSSVIKSFAVNSTFNCERKHTDSLALSPLWRVTFSLNDDPERLQVLPPIEPDIKDKMMLFKVSPYPVPGDQTEKDAFIAQLHAELPAFIESLLKWKIPNHLYDSRMGVKSYYDPDLLEALERIAPEQTLLELIDDEIFTMKRGNVVWKGRARALANELKDPKKPCCKEAEKLLNFHNVAGKYLGRLEKQYPDRIEQWTIYPPGGKSKYLSAPKRPIKNRVSAYGVSTFAGVPVDQPISDQEFADVLSRGERG